MNKPAMYLVRRHAVVYRFEWQEDKCAMMLYTDSDWAGCRRTRKSTSGGVILIGSHCIKSWSHTQGTLALGSAKAEYCSMVEGVMRAKNLQAIGAEIGMCGLETEIMLGTDSSAAKSFTVRRGLGRMRHIEVRFLWLQSEVLKKTVKVVKVKGEDNPADLMTKYLGEKDISKCLHKMNVAMRIISQ